MVGKGPVDAIGGTVKRQVSSRIIQRRAIVKDANSFYQCALDASSVINIFMISAANIKEFVDSQLTDLIDNSAPLPGISNAHQLSVKYDRIEMKSYSTCLTSINSIKSPDENKFKNHVQNKNASIVCGTFVVVNYDFSGSSSRSVISKRLVAVVNRIDGCKLYINYCKTLTKRRLQVISNDEDVIEKNDVIELLGCPNLRRGVYEFGVDLNIDTL